MEKETVKLLNVLRRIARAAGYAAWVKSDPAAARFCVGQYNKVLLRLSELEPAVKPLFTSLGDDTSPEVVRIAARELLAYFDADSPEAFAWSFRGPFAFGGHRRRTRVGCFPRSVTCE
jgi:uncharacterized membrane protein YcjF (UPF0283 family)